MVNKSLNSVLILAFLMCVVAVTACNQIYVKVLPGVPTVYETVRVYGISTWDGEKDPSKARLVESAGKVDAQTVAAMLAQGMKFNYQVKNEGNVSVEHYAQATWARLNNFEVKYRDYVDAGSEKFLLSTADISLVYDMDEENYQEMKRGIGVETRVSLKPENLMSINQVISIAVKQSVSKLYGEAQKDIEGSVWVIKVLPEFNVSGTLSKDTNRYLLSDGKYVPKSAGSLDFLVTLVIRKDYIPANVTVMGFSNSSMTEIVGYIGTSEEDEFILPSFAFEEPKDREKGKAKVKKRTENFIDYITRGFEYKGKSFAPRKDRKRVELESFTYSSQAMIYGDSRQIIIGKGIVKPQPFKKPIVEPTKIEIRQTFKLGNREMLETVLDKLPDLLVFKAIRSYGSIEGMGYFGKKFYWRVFINEKTGELEFEISCDIYMHIKPYNKKY